MGHTVLRILRFDRFELDLARGCLRNCDQEVELRPKTFEVLCYLTENAGRLVSKQQLFEAVWSNVSVCDDSLVQCIRELRQKLGDEERRLIKTVSRRGYLLDAAVSIQEAQSVSEGSAATLGAQKPGTTLVSRALRAIPAHRLRIGAAGVAGLMGLALGIMYLLGPSVLIASRGHLNLAENRPAESNVTGDTELEELAGTLPEKITTELVGGSSVAAEPSYADALIGHWKIGVKCPPGFEFRFSLVFAQVSGGNFAGDVLGDAFGNNGPMLDGRIDGDKISFKRKLQNGEVQAWRATMLRSRDGKLRFDGLAKDPRWPECSWWGVRQVM